MEINFFVAFFAGLVSFFAPCVIPLLPAYIGYVTGVSLKDLKDHGIGKYRTQMLGSSLAYVAGFSLIFVLLGLSVAGLGVLLNKYTQAIQTWGGVLIVILGLNFLGLIKLKKLEQERRLKLPDWINHLGYFRATVIGMIFATAWTPCVGPVLGAILTLAAASKTTWEGGLLLLVYSLGISVPFLFFSLTLSQNGFILKAISRFLPFIQKTSGWFLVLIGLLLANNQLKIISPLFTYDNLNGWLFQLAANLGLPEGLAPIFGV